MKRLPLVYPPVRRFSYLGRDEALRIRGWGRVAWQRLSGAADRLTAARPEAAVNAAVGVGVRERRRGPAWGWLLALGLLVLPLLVYWPTIAQPYGFRDDYSILREAHDEPTKVFRVCAMQARPLYGGFLETSFRMVPGIAGLPWMRAYAALLLGAVCTGVYLLLRSLKWDRWVAFLIGALLAVLPSAQVVVSWAVAWPLAMSLLLALAAFAAAEHGFALAGRRTGMAPSVRRSMAAAGWWATGVFLLTCSALVYQSNALFYFSMVAAALWSHRRWSRQSIVEWLVRHGVTAGVGLGLAFTVMMIAFAQGWLPVSRRVAFEHDGLAKLGWFVSEPLENALGLIALNEDGGAAAVHRVAALSGAVILVGLVRMWQRRGWRNGAAWAAAFLLLPFASFAVNLAVADRWPAYRVLLPLTATVTVLLAIALLAIGGRTLARLGFLALVVPGIWLARMQSFEGFAVPQKAELDLLKAGAEEIDPASHPRVFVITPGAGDHVGRRVYLDEFGSLSTNSYWTPKEMLKLIMWERYPGRPEVTNDYAFECGPALPANRSFDVVIDLRRVRELRPN